jgi:hypothetical protein
MILFASCCSSLKTRLELVLEICLPPCIPLTFNDVQRAETDFFHGEPLRALSTLVYSENVDLQRSASLTFAEITERGAYRRLAWQ